MTAKPASGRGSEGVRRTGYPDWRPDDEGTAGPDRQAVSHILAFQARDGRMLVSLFRQSCRDLRVRFFFFSPDNFLLGAVALPHFVLFTEDGRPILLQRPTLCLLLVSEDRPGGSGTEGAVPED